MLEEIGNHLLKTKYGNFHLFGFNYGENRQNVIALTSINKHSSKSSDLRIQYGCLYATAFFSLDCDCGFQIEYTLKSLKDSDFGIFVYFPEYEGHGIGLDNKMRQIALDLNKQTTENNSSHLEKFPGYGSDVLWVVPLILDKLNAPKDINLWTNNQQKVIVLTSHGLNISETICLPKNVEHNLAIS